VTEELLLQHLESPSRTGRGRVPEPLLATLPAALAVSADTQNSTATILTGQYAPQTLTSSAHGVSRPRCCCALANDVRLSSSVAFVLWAVATSWDWMSRDTLRISSRHLAS
jgi:hypothetical protein